MARFKKGTSGNPKGRPPIAKTSRKLAEFVSDDDLSSVLATVVRHAREGDMQAAALILDRSIPKMKPIADVLAEEAVAEAITAARVRAMRSGGMGLEDLVSYTVISGVISPEPEPPAFIPPLAAPSPPVPAPKPEPEPAPPPVSPELARAFRATVDDERTALVDYDPLTCN